MAKEICGKEIVFPKSFESPDGHKINEEQMKETVFKVESALKDHTQDFSKAALRLSANPESAFNPNLQDCLKGIEKESKAAEQEVEQCVNNFAGNTCFKPTRSQQKIIDSLKTDEIATFEMKDGFRMFQKK